MEAGRGGRSRRREAKGGAYEEIAKLSQPKVMAAVRAVLANTKKTGNGELPMKPHAVFCVPCLRDGSVSSELIA